MAQPVPVVRHQTDSENRARAIQLIADGNTIADTALILQVSPRTIQNWRNQYLDNINGSSKEKYKRKDRDGVRQSTAQQDQVLVQTIKDNPFTPLRQNVATAQFPLSNKSAKRRAKEEGIRPHVAARTELLTETHKENRLNFAVDKITFTVDEYWRRVSFSDESTYSTCNDSATTVYRPINCRYDPLYTVKKKHSGRQTCCCWGCITYEGVGDLKRVERRLNAVGYVEILDDVMMPCVNRLLPLVPDKIFQQDNSPIHTANIVKNWFSAHQNEIELMPWPAKSPDINPIENVWAEVERIIREDDPNHIYQSADSLWDAIEAAWNSLDVNYIRSLYHSMPRRMAAIVDLQGEWTNY